MNDSEDNFVPSDPEKTSVPEEIDKPKVFLGSLIAESEKLGLAESAILEKVKEALEDGANVNDDSLDGHHPLQSAIRSGYQDVALFLIEHGVDLNNKDGSGTPPLRIAINKGHFKVAKALIDHGVKFNRKKRSPEYQVAKWKEFIKFLKK